ncbi:unnamed protein product, partial [Effrenium voratum]
LCRFSLWRGGQARGPGGGAVPIARCRGLLAAGPQPAGGEGCQPAGDLLSAPGGGCLGKPGANAGVQAGHDEAPEREPAPGHRAEPAAHGAGRAGCTAAAPRVLGGERMGERIAALEHSLGHQHQAALERLEGRGSETWRGCLQRMATMEEKVVLQTDVVRIVDRVLGEVRKAGPELFGAGAVTGPAALNEMRKEMRRLEAKVAGLEARVLGIAEDSTAEGRIWRASICAKVETLERAVQDHSGRLAGDETLRREVLESCGQSCEAAEAAATRAQALAAKASQGAREAAAEVVASAEEGPCWRS